MSISADVNNISVTNNDIQPVSVRYNYTTVNDVCPDFQKSVSAGVSTILDTVVAVDGIKWLIQAQSGLYEVSAVVSSGDVMFNQTGTSNELEFDVQLVGNEVRLIVNSLIPDVVIGNRLEIRSCA